MKGLNDIDWGFDDWQHKAFNRYIYNDRGKERGFYFALQLHAVLYIFPTEITRGMAETIVGFNDPRYNVFTSNEADAESVADCGSGTVRDPAAGYGEFPHFHRKIGDGDRGESCVFFQGGLE